MKRDSEIDELRCRHRCRRLDIAQLGPPFVGQALRQGSDQHGVMRQQAREAFDNKRRIEPRRLLQPIGDRLEKRDGAFVRREFVDDPENIKGRAPDAILAGIEQANE